MKILQIVPSIGKDDGITNVLVKYLKAFNSFNSNITFDFLVLNPLPNYKNMNLFRDEITGLGGNIFYLSNPANILLFKKKWQMFCQIHYKEYSYLENNLIFLGFYFKNAKKQLGVRKVITHVHNPVYGDSKLSNLKNKLLYKITGSSLGDILFSSSKNAGVQLFGSVRFSRPWFVINDAFKVNKFKYSVDTRVKIRNEMHWTNKYVIGHVGRFTSQKNHELIIKCFNEVSKIYKNSILILVGKGKDELKIKRLVQKSGLENRVFFLGIRNDVDRLLQGMDLFIFPSKFEGLGVAAVEAQISGVPCIISDRLPEEANISDCKMLNINKPDEWTKEMIKAKNKPRKLNGVNLARQKGFDIESEAKRLEKIYLKELH